MKVERILQMAGALVMLSMFSCSDFFERNLEKSEIELVSPKDGLVTTVVTHTFWWGSVKGADHYNLQIATPTFDSISRLVLDTTTSGQMYPFTLSPGRYEWRVRAENSSSMTDYKVRSLVIDSTSDLTQQSIALISPVNDHYTNDSIVTFKWQGLYNAEDYGFEVRSEDFATGNLYIGPVVIDDTTITYIMDDGEYEWGVRGQSTFTNTVYSIRKVTVDIIAPNTPSLTSPANKDTISDPYPVFKWNRGTETGSPITDSLWVFKDTTNFLVHFGIESSVPSFTTLDSLGNGQFFWQVRSFDKAGNKSELSPIRSFIVQ